MDKIDKDGGEECDDKTESGKVQNLTWCQGEFWEGGCPHSGMEPEPLTDKHGHVRGWISTNHDGTTTTTDSFGCAHQGCLRYCTPKDNHETNVCTPCDPTATSNTCQYCFTSEEATRSEAPESQLDSYDSSEACTHDNQYPSTESTPDGNTSPRTPCDRALRSSCITNNAKELEESARWYAPCATKGCPCTASFNGQANESCSKKCKLHTPCGTNTHYFPSKIPNENAKRQPHNSANMKSLRTISKENNRRIQLSFESKARNTPKSYRSSFSGPRGHPGT
jgi:hypothetical protein